MIRTIPCSTAIWRRMMPAAVLFVLLPLAAIRGLAADAPAPRPPGTDVLVFANGDQLTGTLVDSAGDSVHFHSDMTGDLTIDWAKIKEIRTAQKFAVIENGVKLNRKSPDSAVPQGTVTIADQNVQVQPATGTAPAPIPVKNIAFLIEDPTFQSKLRTEPGFFHAWHGGATAGATIIQATQNTYTFNGALNLVRVIPDVTWLAPRNRTTTDFSGSYGKITDPAYTAPATVGPPPTPATFVPETTVKTSIYHYDFERDEYLTDRFYYLGALAFDHNYSQSLSFQQIYGGGVGYTVIKQPIQTLDLKALIQYERQNFIQTVGAPPVVNLDLIGSTFSANYLRHLPMKMLFNQQVAYIPAWNNLHSYSFTELNTFSIPAYKRLSLTLGTLDSYLNNPAVALPPVKRNSFQFTAGVTYAFK